MNKDSGGTNSEITQAIEKNDIHKVESFIKKGGNVNLNFNEWIEGWTLLMGAIFYNRIDIVKLLIEA